jgi:hypothetical protein
MIKALLILSIITLLAGLALNAGLLGVSESGILYTVLPLGAVFFGLFLIARVLEKESARYDAEHRTPPPGPHPAK